MFKYSIVPDGDNVVREDMKKILEVKKQAKALILFGAFGRGEGLVLNGVPRNDYDLLMIDGTQEIKSLIEDLGLKCMPEIHSVSEADLRDAFPSQQWFEIKYASTPLYGNDYMKLLPEWEPYEIPYGDAINSLERRSISMILAKYELGKDKPDYRKVIEQISKMVIAIGDATLIKRGQFHPKYAVRNLMLSSDNIGPDYNLAVSTKLTGLPDFTTDQLWGWWHQTRNKFRDYSNDNQIRIVLGDALMSITDRVSQEQLADLLHKLGADNWM